MLLAKGKIWLPTVQTLHPNKTVLRTPHRLTNEAVQEGSDDDIACVDVD